ncbi:uncharacterized protein LOC133636079 [Entelurus aequoreus]|uniref:uncharacterized protein LOC133636079 n=1 Tax=Entelurus aequoreus TaxID=161455 RepID=UPI002B1D4B38|nr:uncharacterized protein LOC133636079 [Entelurus aequoreus]XP_061885716.1 uncharacterized protein LOC133636079 [Entelurus aequoreus]
MTDNDSGSSPSQQSRTWPDPSQHSLKKKNSGKRRQSFPPDVKKGHSTKSFLMQFYLVNKHIEKTTKAAEELQLLQAGMGRRTINVTEDADHLWLSRKLEETYAKMIHLKGAWMLYKAVGGSGQRKLCILPPEAEGYTGRYLSAVGRGKSALYIVPVQGNLDMTPLPNCAKEFERIPKVTCHTCSVGMPVQLLAAHVAFCGRDKILDITIERARLFCSR